MNLLNCAPTRLTNHCALPITNTRLRAFTLTNKRLTPLFLSCVVSIVSYGLRLRNPRKATGPSFIPLKFIKFASNVIDSQHYNIIKDLEKNKYSKEPKTALVRPTFKKNESSKIGNYKSISILDSLKFMKDVFTIVFLLMLKQYQISYQLIKNSVVQIMSY